MSLVPLMKLLMMLQPRLQQPWRLDVIYIHLPHQASLLFVDNPVGTGFSYVEEGANLTATNAEIAADLMAFLRAFLHLKPQVQRSWQRPPCSLHPCGLLRPVPFLGSWHEGVPPVLLTPVQDGAGPHQHCGVRPILSGRSKEI